MQYQELVNYIRAARQQHAPDKGIREVLTAAGWKTADVDAAFSVCDRLEEKVSRRLEEVVGVQATAVRKPPAPEKLLRIEQLPRQQPSYRPVIAPQLSYSGGKKRDWLAALRAVGVAVFNAVAKGATMVANVFVTLAVKIKTLLQTGPVELSLEIERGPEQICRRDSRSGLRVHPVRIEGLPQSE